jgi:hypothetical protein
LFYEGDVIRQYASAITYIMVIALIFIMIHFVKNYGMGQDYHDFQANYEGPLKCKECHPKQYFSWEYTPMANSFNLLRSGEHSTAKLKVRLDPEQDYSHDEGCLPCHTTGYNVPGGFISFEKTPVLAGVTCEACHKHGARQSMSTMDRYLSNYNAKAGAELNQFSIVREKICQECHNSKSPFWWKHSNDDLMKKTYIPHKHYQSYLQGYIK